MYNIGLNKVTNQTASLLFWSSHKILQGLHPLHSKIVLLMAAGRHDPSSITKMCSKVKTLHSSLSLNREENLLPQQILCQITQLFNPFDAENNLSHPKQRGRCNFTSHFTLKFLYRYILFNSISIFMVWFGGFYGISTFVGYLMPNPFLCK